MEIFVSLLVLGGGGLVIWGFISFVRRIGQALAAASTTKGKTPSTRSEEINGMNNGDYYNGPYGYSPMTGYPETQCGSDFDQDAKWYEEH